MVTDPTLSRRQSGVLITGYILLRASASISASSCVHAAAPCGVVRRHPWDGDRDIAGGFQTAHDCNIGLRFSKGVLPGGRPVRGAWRADQGAAYLIEWRHISVIGDAAVVNFPLPTMSSGNAPALRIGTAVAQRTRRKLNSAAQKLRYGNTRGMRGQVPAHASVTAGCKLQIGFLPHGGSARIKLPWAESNAGSRHPTQRDAARFASNQRGIHCNIACCGNFDGVIVLSVAANQRRNASWGRGRTTATEAR